jgi:hypothetical protein
MTTNTVTLEPETITDLAQSLETEFKRADLREIKIHTLDPNRIRIETPVRRLADYHFVCAGNRCSWKTAKKHIVVYLKHFCVEQRAENQLFYVDLSPGHVLPSFLLDFVHEPRTSVRDIFVTRSLRAVEGLKSLDEANLVEAVKAPTDYSVLVRALNTEEALTSVENADPLAAARLRGIQAKRKLLESEGGAISSAQAAHLLKMTRQAVDKRRKEGKLLGLELGKRGYVYPAWQFGLTGFGQVLSALGSQDFWESLSFFLNPSEVLEGQTPLEALTKKGDVEKVTRAAKTYGEHGA